MVTRIITSALIALTFLSGITAQDKACGTSVSDKDIIDRNELQVIPFNLNRARTDAPTKIAITAHVARRDDGTGGLAEQDLLDAIDNVNVIYQLTNMEFFIFGDINYIDDSEYFDFESSQEVELASQHFVENTINIYFFNSAKSGENFVCGYARFPGSGIDRIVMDNSCATNGSTLPHEIGHYFALYHTHGKSNSGTTDELVDGSNCDVAGDDICDTPADPNLSGNVDGTCSYTGETTDANGDTYAPNPRNLMSYSRKECRDQFSQGQADVIVAAYQQYKTYLYDKNYASNFDAMLREVCIGESVSFEEKAVNAVSYLWTLEGATPSTSTEANPTVVYNAEGVFDVTLEITEEGGGTDTKVVTDFIQVKAAIETEATNSAGSFEEASLEETIINQDGGTSWVQSSSASSEGSNSAYMDFFNYGAVGEEDYLIVATLNTEAIKSYELTFDYAYAPYDETYFDGLAVEYRDPCGTWQTVWFKEGADLATTANQTGIFVPTSEQWKTETVLVEVLDDEVGIIEIALKAINGYGNSLYVDNYSVDLFEDVFTFQDFTVTNASCSDTEDGTLMVSVNGLGTYQYSIDGENFSESNEFTSLLPGTYTVTVRNNSGTTITSQVEILYDNEYPATPVITSSQGELSITLEGNQTVRWFLDEVELPGEILPTISDPERGSYTAEVKRGFCAVMSDPFVVLSVTDVEAITAIYPNPADDRITIETSKLFNLNGIDYTISVVSGKQVKRGSYDQFIDVSALDDGLYLLQMQLDEQVITRRFVKK